MDQVPRCIQYYTDGLAADPQVGRGYPDLYAELPLPPSRLYINR
jgi:hypothetical protein